ncbi:glutathione S-transferase family protein [Sphingobium subterraneum]|uniref:GST-like protein n=1 Tax=Sphingobium subterraneum TaxID=627688 RepID=A0A841IYI1_9SPHN|nr:glutathione S-transferase family protein [Sphingobium subterraneum]MBB6123723.1 GST-like protein [Sphingobium subterraneum]
MIELWGLVSPNAIKVQILLEELGLPYRAHKVDTFRLQQYSPEFLAMNPIGKYPVLIDPDGAGPDQPIFESGAILIYLAETYGQALLPMSGPARWETLKWLVAQVAWVGPMLGQHHHFYLHPSETDTYAGKRYQRQANRVMDVLEGRIRDRSYFAGEHYSVADIAIYPWLHWMNSMGYAWDDYPSLSAWHARVEVRPAVGSVYTKVRGYQQDMAEFIETNRTNPEAFNAYFGREAGAKQLPDFGIGLPSAAPK